MIAALRTPARRIAVAIALSVLVHLVILWLPHMQPAPPKVQLPPLTARLETLPKPALQPAQAQAVQAEPVHPLPAPAVIKPDAAPPPRPANTVPDKAHVAAVPPQLFPSQIHLSYAVYKGASSFKIGDIYSQLEIHGDNYMLRSDRLTSGLASLLGSEHVTQISRGKIGKQGLRPEIFSEEIISAGGAQSRQATFDWTAQKISFLHGIESALPDAAQDALSFTYQLSLLPLMNREIIPLVISDGGQIDNYELEIGGEENITTPIGELRALHLRKMHIQGVAYYEIWLGLEYRLLPVKLRQVDSAGDVTEEIVISDIRIADQ